MRKEKGGNKEVIGMKTIGKRRVDVRERKVMHEGEKVRKTARWGFYLIFN